MKAYEAAKKLKMENKDFLAEYGIKSHSSNITPELEAELFGEEKKIETEPQGTETATTAETVVIDKAEECPYTVRQIRKSCRMLGNKSPCWEWRHLG